MENLDALIRQIQEIQIVTRKAHERIKTISAGQFEIPRDVRMFFANAQKELNRIRIEWQHDRQLLEQYEILVTLLVEAPVIEDKQDYLQYFLDHLCVILENSRAGIILNQADFDFETNVYVKTDDFAFTGKGSYRVHSAISIYEHMKSVQEPYLTDNYSCLDGEYLADNKHWDAVFSIMAVPLFRGEDMLAILYIDRHLSYKPLMPGHLTLVTKIAPLLARILSK